MSIPPTIYTYPGFLFPNLTRYHKTPFHRFYGNLSPFDKTFFKERVRFTAPKWGGWSLAIVTSIKGHGFFRGLISTLCIVKRLKNPVLIYIEKYNKYPSIRPLIRTLKYIVIIVYSDQCRAVNNDVRDKKSFFTSGQPVHYVTWYESIDLVFKTLWLT